MSSRSDIGLLLGGHCSPLLFVKMLSCVLRHRSDRSCYVVDNLKSVL